jgi:hypothetical protein
MCELYINYVLRDETSADQVASTIVHEAQHARLHRLGIRYVHDQRARIEHACYRAERGFGLRLPEGQTVVGQAEAGMALDPQVFSDQARLEAKARALLALPGPKWFARHSAELMRRKARTLAEAGLSKDEPAPS